MKRKSKKLVVHEEEAQNTISDYIFAFELTKQYPTVRSYLIKQPLKKSFKDTLMELFSGRIRG